MATFLFEPHFYDHYDPTPELPSYERLAPEIRLSIFLITGLCVGLPALLWTLRLLYRHHKSGSKVSVFIIFLLLTDALEMVLSPYILTKLLSGEKCYYANVLCKILTSLWSGARSCGFHFPQLVALESILSLTHPDRSAHIFYRPFSISLSIIGFLLVMISGFSFTFHVFLTLVLFPARLFIFAILCKLIYTAPPFHQAVLADRKRGLKTLAVSMVTYVFLYLPGFVVMSMYISSHPYDHHYYYPALIMTVSLESLRVFTDPLLCVLVCRENDMKQKSQTHIELNTDLRSV